LYTSIGAGFADKSFGARNPILAIVVRGACGVMIWGWYPLWRRTNVESNTHIELITRWEKVLIHGGLFILGGNGNSQALSLEGLPSYGHDLLGC
jgi:hypothetical protein